MEWQSGLKVNDLSYNKELRQVYGTETLYYMLYRSIGDSGIPLQYIITVFCIILYIIV